MRETIVTLSLQLSIVDAAGVAVACSATAAEVVLVHAPAYRPGDRIRLVPSAAGFAVVQLDDAMPPALLYLTGPLDLAVPFGDDRIPYSPRAFAGEMHRLTARAARDEEVAARRNLAVNPYDHARIATAFPHAHANVETRGEAVFAARNAIDGEKAADDHGKWPWTSWGINRDPAAALTVSFGRPVVVDEAVIYGRADFPHDAWWERATLVFSDGSEETVTLEKTGAGQSRRFAPRRVAWARLERLVKADDPSPFPALTQLELWGGEG
jgi:hypothetical protein